jgi:predicted RNase H-like HicB family nuclease
MLEVRLGGVPARDFRIIGETPQRALRESQRAIDGHLKNAAHAAHQLNVRDAGGAQLVSHTESRGFVISLLAVFDAYFHGASPSNACLMAMVARKMTPLRITLRGLYAL